MTKKFFLLVKIQLLSYFGINKALHAGEKERKKLFGRVALVVFVLVYFVFISYTFSNGVAAGINMLGGDLAVIPTLMFAASSLLVLVMGIYAGGKTLFAYKDYDQIMSLPVSCFTVVASRMAVLYLFELLYALVILAPAGVVYALRSEHVEPLFYPVFLLCVLATPMIPLVVSAIVSTFITALTSRMKRFGSVFSTVLSIVVVLGCFIVPQLLNSGDISAMVGSVYSVLDYYPPTALFSGAVCSLDLGDLALFLVISVGLFVAFDLLVSLRYRQICSRVSSGGVSKRMKAGDIRTRGPLAALYRRELKRYFSCSIYVTNTIIGHIMAIAACAALLIFGGVDKLAAIGGEELAPLLSFLNDAAPYVLSILLCMGCTTGSAVSLEGRQLWIIKSLPQSAGRLMTAKALVCLTMSVPTTLICCVLLALSVSFSGPQLVALFVIPLIFDVFAAVFGLFINLKLPKLDWQQEVQVVKQSMAAMISMLGSALVPLAFTFAAKALGAYSYALMLIPLAATVVFILWIRRRGDAILRAL